MQEFHYFLEVSTTSSNVTYSTQGGGTCCVTFFVMYKLAS